MWIGVLKYNKLKRVRRIASTAADIVSSAVMWSAVIAAIYLTVIINSKREFNDGKEKGDR